MAGLVLLLAQYGHGLEIVDYVAQSASDMLVQWCLPPSASRGYLAPRSSTFWYASKSRCSKESTCFTVVYAGTSRRRRKPFRTGHEIAALRRSAVFLKPSKRPECLRKTVLSKPRPICARLITAYTSPGGPQRAIIGSCLSALELRAARGEGIPERDPPSEGK